MRNLVLFGCVIQFLSGCWTFSESQYPSTAVTRAGVATSNLVLKVEGFEASFTEYESVYGYSTVYVPGYLGRHYYHPGYYGAVQTCTYVPTVRSTDMFRQRAKEELEDAGFVLAGTAVPDYIIEVRFTGPITSSGDACACWAWRLLTVFFCDYAAEGWSAKMRIRDNRTGRIVFHHDYLQRYETNVFGLVPIFSIASATETSSSHIQSWCLAALTDRAMADASSFFQTCPRASD